MILKAIVRDEKLIDKLNDIDDFDVIFENTTSFDSRDCDAYVVDEKLINLSEISNLKDKNIKCFLIHEKTEDFSAKYDMDFMQINNIIPISQTQDVDLIVDYIVRKIKKARYTNNVYGFFGADSKVGTSIISCLVAMNIANRSENKSVFYLPLSGQEGLDWISANDYDMSLSDAKVSLKNNMMNISELKRISYSVYPNFYTIKGESNIAESQLYHQQEIFNLIELIKNNFDVVIIDLGNTNNLLLRMTYAGLVSSDNKILVTNQYRKSMFMYEKANQQAFKYFNMEKFKFVVVNSYMSTSFLSKVKNIESQYKLPVLAKLPYLDYNVQAQHDVDPFSFEQDNEYKKGIRNIVELIEKKQNIKVNVPKKRGFLNFINRR